MSDKYCPICESDFTKFSEAVLLYKYNVEYHRCVKCGLIVILNPFFLDEAYKELDHDPDDGRWYRNGFISNIIKNMNLPVGSTILDYGCSKYKLMVEYLPQFKVTCFDRYVEGINIRPEEIFDVIVSLEVTEHIPCDEFRNYLDYVMSSKITVLTTGVFDFDNPQTPDKEGYYCCNYGQHIIFINNNIINMIAEQYNKTVDIIPFHYHCPVIIFKSK